MDPKEMKAELTNLTAIGIQLTILLTLKVLRILSAAVMTAFHLKAKSNRGVVK